MYMYLRLGGEAGSVLFLPAQRLLQFTDTVVFECQLFMASFHFILGDHRGTEGTLVTCTCMCVRVCVCVYLEVLQVLCLSLKICHSRGQHLLQLTNLIYKQTNKHTHTQVKSITRAVTISCIEYSGGSGYPIQPSSV